MTFCHDCPSPPKCTPSPRCVGVGGFSPRIWQVKCARCGEKMRHSDEAEGCEDPHCPLQFEPDLESAGCGGIK